VLAPFGHITWTALLGGALFASSRGGRFHLTARLAGTLVGVVALHAVSDQAYGWAVALQQRRDRRRLGARLAQRGALGPGPSSQQLVWFNVFYNGVLAVIGLIGLIWILREWRVYGRWRTARG